MVVVVLGCNYLGVLQKILEAILPTINQFAYLKRAARELKCFTTFTEIPVGGQHIVQVCEGLLRFVGLCSNQKGHDDPYAEKGFIKKTCI